jgi:hypothetical protein
MMQEYLASNRPRGAILLHKHFRARFGFVKYLAGGKARLIQVTAPEVPGDRQKVGMRKIGLEMGQLPV